MRRLPELLILAPLTAVASLGQVTAAEAQRPVAVSPGNSKGVVISDPCPTFSWGAERGAQSYELVVYRLDRDDETAEPILSLHETVVGSASSWTPSLDRCLERGGQYAWSIRALGPEASDWSRPKLFDLASAPTRAEFEEALQVVRSYLAAQGETAALRAEPAGTAGPEVQPLQKPAKSSPQAKGVAVPTLFHIAGGAHVGGDLELAGNLVSAGDICIGTCP